MKDKEPELINKKRLLLKQKIENAGSGLGVFAIGATLIFSGAGANTDGYVILGAVLITIGILFTVASAFTIVFRALSKIDRFLDLLIRIIDFVKNRKTKKFKIATPSRYKLLKLSEIFFSAKTQKEIFLQAMADWDEEIYEALEKNKEANLFIINVRNTYAFLAAMWMKSPVGNLIEFIKKVAK